MAAVLETIAGDLKDAYKQLVPGTMLHVDQLMNERRTHPDKQVRQELRNQWFYTADGEVYFLDGARKTPTLLMTREAHNPVLRHIDDAFAQLTQNGNYHPSQEDVQQALAAPETLLLALSTLRLKGGNSSEWGCLEIGTTPVKYGKLNYKEMELAERVYGRENDFVENMKMLNDFGIDETRIYVLNPEYVKKHAETGAIARASLLYYFSYDSRFHADIRYIHDYIRVRGVRRVASVGEQEAPIGAMPKNEISPPLENIGNSHEQLPPRTIYKPADLEYAKRMLQGIPSGTVMDWKK